MIYYNIYVWKYIFSDINSKRERSGAQMLGWIKSFCADSKSGVIVGADVCEYSFCITDMIGYEFPVINSVVEFQPTDDKENKKALCVKITQRSEERPQYINIGNTRIKLSDIILYWTDTDVKRNFRDRGFWKTPEYVGDTNTYYIYIRTSKDKEFDYTLSYTDEAEFRAACATLDRCLLTVSL